MERDIDISGSFKVGSWLLSVDTLNREQLLKSCKDWRPEHTQLLKKELDAQIEGASILGVDLVRTTPKKLVYASAALEKYSAFPSAPIAIGLNLI